MQWTGVCNVGLVRVAALGFCPINPFKLELLGCGAYGSVQDYQVWVLGVFELIKLLQIDR